MTVGDAHSKEEAQSIVERASPRDVAINQDEEVRIINEYDGPREWTKEEERKLRRKVDYKLMPVLCFTYGLQYYDKAMLGQAAVFGLIKDLHLRGTRFSWSSSVFYFGFLIGAYPAMVLAQRFPAERVASGLVVVWGLCLILTSVCTTWQGLIAQRFFLGFLEAGVSPLFMLIVGSFYTKKEQALRTGIWYSCTGFSAVFAPLINYGFGLIGGGVSSWRYMYYFAGSLTLAWGIGVLFLLPPEPTRAGVKGFSRREQYILVARLRVNNTGIKNVHLKWDQVLELLRDLRFWLAFGMALCSMLANAPLSTFSTIIITKRLGFSGLHALLLTIPLGAYAGCFIVTCSWLAMRYKNRRTYIYFFAQMLTVLASLLLWKLPSTQIGGLLFALYTLPSVGGSYCVLMSMHLANTAGYTKRSAASSSVFIGYCIGNIIGPLVFRHEDAPEYAPGFIVVVITAIVAALFGLLYRVVCVRDNARRDGTGVVEGFDNAFNDDSTDTKNPQFRYVY